MVETQLQPQADFDAVVAHEHAISSFLDGRSVLMTGKRQLSLF